VRLQVSRSIGDLGAVTVTWQVDPREATVLDFSPSSGTIKLENGQVHADIVIYILDDTVPEEMEVSINTAKQIEFINNLYVV